MDLEEIRIRWREIVHLVYYYTEFYPQINHQDLRDIIHTVIPLNSFERVVIYNPNLVRVIESVQKEV